MAEKITLKSMLANLPQKTDVDTVVGRDSSGNPVYIKKSDLAQVVAELTGISDFFKPKTINNGKDANDAVSSGIYLLQGTALNIPGNQNFILVVFRDMDLVSKPILQFAVSYSNRFYYRIKWYNNDWNDWVGVSIVG